MPTLDFFGGQAVNPHSFQLEFLFSQLPIEVKTLLVLSDEG